jgi:polyisoprenyl-phosphate glycosyltransferase
MTNLSSPDYRVPPGQLLYEEDGRPEISLVVPVYYNAESLVQLYDRIARTMESAGARGWDITFVDDGSKDASREVLETLYHLHDNVRIVHMAKNHGSTPAMIAGMGFARGHSVVIMAADLQDPPELLEELVVAWRSGVPVVIATRSSRSDPLLSRMFAAIYYRLFRLLVSPEMPPGGFDVVLMDERVSSLIVRHAEKNSQFTAALLSLGFERRVISYHREARPYGKSRWTFWRKFKLMYDSILSYSYRPLRMVTAAGVLGMFVAAGYGALIVYYRLTSPPRVPGWASLMIVTLFFNGLVLTALGIVGEYIWRTFDAARPSPLHVVDCYAEPRGLGERGAENGAEHADTSARKVH